MFCSFHLHDPCLRLIVLPQNAAWMEILSQLFCMSVEFLRPWRALSLMDTVIWATSFSCVLLLWIAGFCTSNMPAEHKSSRWGTCLAKSRLHALTGGMRGWNRHIACLVSPFHSPGAQYRIKYHTLPTLCLEREENGSPSEYVSEIGDPIPPCHCPKP